VVLVVIAVSNLVTRCILKNNISGTSGHGRAAGQILKSQLFIYVM